MDPPQDPFYFDPVGGDVPLPESPIWPGVARTPGFFRARAEQRFNLPYQTVENSDGVYDSLRVITNRRRFSRDSTETLAMGYDRGILREGNPPDGQWSRSSDGRALEVRIPWMLLNFTDPSEHRVLQGPKGESGIQGKSLEEAFPTRRVEGIGMVMGMREADGSWRNWPESGDPSDVALFTWPTWEEPAWEARARPVYQVLRDTFRELEGWNPVSPGQGSFPWSGRPVPPPSQVGPPRADTIPATPPQLASSVREEAADAWNRGDTEVAETLYESILAADSSDARALHRLALIHGWRNEFSTALELFDRLLREEPENLEAGVDRARVLAWQGELGQAIQALDRILEGRPDYPPALEARAQFQSWAGEYSEALTSYDRLLGITQDPTGVLLAQARILGWASRVEESQALYDSILAQNPGDLEARLGEARLLAVSDQAGSAVARYRVILQDHPGNLEARQGLARALTWSGRLPEGEEAWRSSMKASPEDLVSRVGLAQNLRWQGRNAAALGVLEAADPAQKEKPDFLEQLRWVRASLAPMAGFSLIREGDSDDNVMTTLQMTGGWNPWPRIAVRGEAYRRELARVQAGPDLTHNSLGVNLQAEYQMEPGWVFSVGTGGVRTDGPGRDSFSTLKAEVSSPGRYSYGGAVKLSRYPLDATAQLVERGVRVGVVDLSGRWAPAPGWQLAGSAGVGTFTGEEENQRLHANLRLDRRLPGGWTLGLSHRYFAFDKKLAEFYFDPDYFGLTELASRWTWAAGRFSFLAEAAPGAQKIGSGGKLGAALRASTRVAFRFEPGKELSVSAGYSSAGLQSFSTEDGEYRYRALILSGNWVF